MILLHGLSRVSQALDAIIIARKDLRINNAFFVLIQPLRERRSVSFSCFAPYIHFVGKLSPVRICRGTRNDARAELGAEMHLQNFEKIYNKNAFRKR